MKLTPTQFADLDARMGMPKKIMLVTQWAATGDSSGEYTRTCSLSAAGIGLSDQLVLTAYPGVGHKNAKAHYQTSSNYQAARLEMGHVGMSHSNRGVRPPGMPARVAVPHVHLWHENRARLQSDGAGAQLPLANRLPRADMDWEEAVRWFIEMCQIAAPMSFFPVGLPQSEALF